MNLSRTTSGFALAAAITVLFNTLLACIKDSYKPLNTFMAGLTGHQWTTHGLVDLLLFVGLGLAFASSGLGEKMDPARLSAVLVGSVVVSAVGLMVWYLVM